MIALICRQKRSENGQENERDIYREMTITRLICRKRQNPENQQRRRCITIKLHREMAMAMANRLIDRNKKEAEIQTGKEKETGKRTKALRRRKRRRRSSPWLLQERRDVQNGSSISRAHSK